MGTKCCCCLLLLGALLGCGGGIDPNDAVARLNSTNMQRVANLYLTYQLEHDWRGPADEAQLKEFVRTYDPKRLERINVDPSKLDELFISERDGQPFKIRYGVPGNMMGSTEPVVFEATGVDGLRMVGFLSMEQREVDSDEYDALLAGQAPINKTPARDQ